MNRRLAVAALASGTVLALPSAALAHPSVYESEALIGPALTPETRYVVTNHGFTVLLKETNGLASPKGVVGYNLAPSAWRTGKDFATVMTHAGTGAQAHATCVGAAALESEAAIKSWQDADAFYNYVPFQTEAAGLEDTPSRWLTTLAAAGVTTADLATVETRTAKCLALGGTYTPADATQSSVAALAEGVTKPLQEKVNTTTAANTTLTNDLNAAKTQIASLTLAATPIKLTLASAKAKTVASKGAQVTIAAQPLKPVAVAVTISDAQARKLKLKSTVLGTKTATTAADGTAAVTVKLSKAAAKAVKALKKSISVEVTVTSGDRFASAKSKFTR